MENNNSNKTVISYDKEKMEFALNLLNQLNVTGIHNSQIIAQMSVILSNPISDENSTNTNNNTKTDIGK